MRPNTFEMVRAKVQVDANLNKVLELLVAPDGAPLKDASLAKGHVDACIASARAALGRFERAARG